MTLPDIDAIFIIIIIADAKQTRKQMSFLLQICKLLCKLLRIKASDFRVDFLVRRRLIAISAVQRKESHVVSRCKHAITCFDDEVVVTHSMGRLQARAVS